MISFKSSAQEELFKIVIKLCGSLLQLIYNHLIALQSITLLQVLDFPPPSADNSSQSNAKLDKSNLQKPTQTYFLVTLLIIFCQKLCQFTANYCQTEQKHPAAMISQPHQDTLAAWQHPSCKPSAKICNQSYQNDLIPLQIISFLYSELTRAHPFHIVLDLFCFIPLPDFLITFFCCNWAQIKCTPQINYPDRIKLVQIKLQMRKTYLFQRRQSNQRSSTVSKSQVSTRSDQSIRFYVGPGNNSDLIRRVLGNRKHFTEVESSKQALINLRWQQSSKNYKYEGCIANCVFKHCLNHFEYHQQLSNKEYLFKNIYEYCQNHKINVFSFVPLTFVLNIVDSAFQQNQTFFVNFYNAHKPKPNQANEEIHLRRRRFNPNHTLCFSRKSQANHCKYQILSPFASQNSPYLWILKPTFYNRGNGVHVFNTLSEMQSLMNRYIQGVSQSSTIQPSKTQNEGTVRKSFRIRQIKDSNLFMIRSNSFVVQKYMQRPLLFAGRKFDIRMWVLFTHQLKVYLFKSGYLRTSSYQYNLNSEKVADLNVHLTNNAVQKYNEDYGRYQQGNQLCFDRLRQLVESRGENFQELMAKIKEIVKITALSVKKKINKHERSYCFQVFGYDFMVDEDCNPWLIEVNTNPCIEQSSPVLQQLIPRMLDDAFALTIDQIFDTRPKHQVAYPVRQEPDDENLWQMVVDLKKTF